MTIFRGIFGAFGIVTVATSLAIGTFSGQSATFAQTIPTAVLKPFSLKAGLFNPSEPSARRAGSDAIFSLEAEYTVENLIDVDGSYSVFSVGYLNQDNFRVIPITIGQNFTDGRQNYYYGFGVGVYNVELDLPGLTSGKNKWIFGGYGVLGLNLTKTVFTEVKYHYPYKYDNQFIGGFQLMAGLRF